MTQNEEISRLEAIVERCSEIVAVRDTVLSLLTAMKLDAKQFASLATKNELGAAVMDLNLRIGAIESELQLLRDAEHQRRLAWQAQSPRRTARTRPSAA
jgi:hypothetical protein